MHIAYLHYLGPHETGLHHVHQFANSARELGHRVDVHGLNLPASEVASKTEGRLSEASSLRRYLSRYLYQPRELLRNARYLGAELALLRASLPEVLLVRHDLLAASFVFAARRLKLPLVLEANAPVSESRLYDDRHFHLFGLPERLESWKLHRSDGVTVVSSALKDYLAKTWSVPNAKFTVVPNGANSELFHPGVVPDTDLPDAFRQNDVVGFVGSFQKFHGSELIAQMVNEVGARRPSVHFLFVGDGPEAETVRRETTSLGNRILFTGTVPHDRVPGLVAALDIAVLPETAFYCSPLKVVEWMAAGRAVVAPRYGPLEELIEDRVSGLLFSPRQVDAMNDAILGLVDDPENRRRLGQAAALRARTSLSWTENARRVMEACGRALESHRHS